MDFKAEGLWDTEKYYRPLSLADKTIFWPLHTLEWLKQKHFDLACSLLIKFCFVTLSFFFPFVSFPFHGSFYINSWQLKVVSYFRKSSILDVLQGSEYASEWKIWKHEDSKNRNKQQVLKTKNRTVFLGLSERWKNILKICARGDTLYDIIAGSCYVKKLHWKFY